MALLGDLRPVLEPVLPGVPRALQIISGSNNQQHHHEHHPSRRVGPHVIVPSPRLPVHLIIVIRRVALGRRAAAVVRIRLAGVGELPTCAPRASRAAHPEDLTGTAGDVKEFGLRRRERAGEVRVHAGDPQKVLRELKLQPVDDQARRAQHGDRRPLRGAVEETRDHPAVVPQGCDGDVLTRARDNVGDASWSCPAPIASRNASR
mmetsp:Transcript_110265/g.284912  ORF Transcript_110265/g.284912 Transcript_110265/m.284912 type:complete len:205 (-) Transcript_110265:61-675(-)